MAATVSLTLLSLLLLDNADVTKGFLGGESDWYDEPVAGDYKGVDDVVAQRSVNVVINITSGVVNTVDLAFLSGAFDMILFTKPERRKGFNFTSKRLQTLVFGLSPMVIRVGGSTSSKLFFDVPLAQITAANLEPGPVVMNEVDVIGLAGLAFATGSRVLMDLNGQLRMGTQWDPTNAIALMAFVTNQGVASCMDWELGNEPEYYTRSPLTSNQVAADFLTLHRVVSSYPSLAQSRIVGPDVDSLAPGSTGYNILRAVANSAGGFLHAATIHQYYFPGTGATYVDYINPAYFSALSTVISDAKSALSGSDYPRLPLWIGETSDAFQSGTVNVSDRFVSGFLWLDKLGLAARQGVTLVVRQTIYGGNYGLVGSGLEPNPDYWVSLIHNRLVGTSVLDVGLSFPSKPVVTIRLYAHCAAPTAPNYQRGSVVVFGVNISPNASQTLVFPAWPDQPIDVYLLTPANNDVLSSVSLLNGAALEMIDDVTLPEISPVAYPAGKSVVMPALSMGFFVVPGAEFGPCSKAESGTWW